MTDDDKIVQFMQRVQSRLTIGHRWLVVNESGRYEVYERTPGMRHTVTLADTTNISYALAVLERGGY